MDDRGQFVDVGATRPVVLASAVVIAAVLLVAAAIVVAVLVRLDRRNVAAPATDRESEPDCPTDVSVEPSPG